MPSKVVPVIDENKTASKMPILGTYEGECADSNITNLNGLDITREVWENVFNSEDYQNALEHGWYIGYLGHPEDPNCMDFMNACIVMTEGSIDRDGKVYGKFNLIDTPVGRIVAAFQDAGVVFGISVRGAGDIVANSVDPDTFVFRGFDLVTFPAFPESIPKFTKVAASSDPDTQAKYKKVCAAVTANVKDINSVDAINIIQSQFAKQSPEYTMLENRKAVLSASSVEDIQSITAAQVQGMTNLYLEQVNANFELRRENISLRRKLASVESAAKRKIRALKRITSAQAYDMQLQLHESAKKCAVLSSANTHLKEDNSALSRDNLKYNREITAGHSSLKDKDDIISELRTQLSETVAETKSLRTKTSNRDAEVKRLSKELVAASKSLEEYQSAYANLYATALGADIHKVNIEASMSVRDLQRIISSTSTANISTVFVEPDVVDVVDEESEESLVTI